MKESLTKLLQQQTQVRLGTFVEIAGLKLFKVEYEVPSAVAVEDIDKLKNETGLTAQLITLVTTVKTNTTDVDGQADGYGGYTFAEVVTNVNVDVKYVYTYY